MSIYVPHAQNEIMSSSHAYPYVNEKCVACSTNNVYFKLKAENEGWKRLFNIVFDSDERRESCSVWNSEMTRLSVSIMKR